MTDERTSLELAMLRVRTRLESEGTPLPVFGELLRLAYDELAEENQRLAAREAEIKTEMKAKRAALKAKRIIAERGAQAPHPEGSA